MTTKHCTVRAAAVAAALALATAGPSIARAQDAAAAMTDEARKLYDEGRKAKEKGDHATCVAKLRAAWALVQHRQVAGLLGECELRTGAHREAAEHLAHFLDHAGDASPEAVAAVRKLYDEARAEVAVVTVRASVEGADRKVDGRPLAPEERRVFLAPGEHVFAASKPGGGAGEKKVFVSAGQEREVVIELASDAPSPAAPSPAGPARGPMAPPPVEEDDGPNLIPGLVLGGVGLVGLGVGVGLLAGAGSAGSDAESIAAGINADGGDCVPVTEGFEEPCAAFFDSVDQQDTLNAAGTVAMIGGGVLLAGGVTWMLIEALGDDGGGDEASAPRRGREEPRPRVAIVPAGGPGGGALHLRGTFW